MLFRLLDDISTQLKDPPVVVIGNFDGVHKGHRALLKTAATEGETVVVLTFDPHPVQYFRRDRSPFLLSTIEERSKALHSAGATHVIALAFDDDFANTEARNFVQRVLVDALHVKTVIVGQQFVFGRGRAGNVELIEQLGVESGFKTIGIDLVEFEEERASSTRIRDAIRTGDIKRANQMLGRAYSVSGPVVHGDARGGGLGFPTANTKIPPDRLVPPPGIYAAWFSVGDDRWAAATYIGKKPTFDGTDLVVESFVLDAPKNFDLYEQHGVVEFEACIRGDQKFDSAEELVEQMHKDVEEIRELLSSMSDDE